MRLSEDIVGRQNVIRGTFRVGPVGSYFNLHTQYRYLPIVMKHLIFGIIYLKSIYIRYSPS